MDETWIHHYTPETKRSSAEWTAASESRPKSPKTQQWAGKVMASVFWGAHGILFIDYLERGKTINRDYYMALLDRFHQDNAPCHKFIKTMVKLNELNFESLLHPPYSPELAPSDSFWEQRRIILQKRHRKVRKALKRMYYAWKKLC